MSAATEVAIELTYRAQVAPWLSIQPTLQFIRHPGLSSSALDARIAGIRFEIAY